MKHRFTKHLNSMAVAALVLLATAGNTMAMTKAGTPVTNDVTLDYQVNGAPQTQLTDDTTFMVDNKVNLVVTNIDGGNVTVLPDGGGVLTFSLTNEGNFPQGYTARALYGGSNFEMGSFDVYYDNGDGSFDINEDTLVTAGTRFENIDPYQADGTTYKVEADRTVTLFIVASDAPLVEANANTSIYHLLVTTLDAGTNTETQKSADATDKNDIANIETPLVLFADAGGPAAGDDERDGKGSAAGTFVYSTTTLFVDKAVVVISDPVNGTTLPMAIPGAVVEYTVTITNTGLAGTPVATNIGFADILPNTIEIDTNAYGADQTVELIVDGGTPEYSGTYNAGTRTVSVTGFSLEATKVATIKFQAEIQ